MTTSNNMVRSLIGLRCNNLHEHQTVEGKTHVQGKAINRSTFTENYPRKFARRLAMLMGKVQIPHEPVYRNEAWSVLAAEEHPEAPAPKRVRRERYTSLKISRVQDVSKLPWGKRQKCVGKTTPIDSMNSWKRIFEKLHQVLPRVGKTVIHDDEILESIQKLIPEKNIHTLIACRGASRTLAPPETLVKGLAPFRRSVFTERGSGEIRAEEDWENWEMLAKRNPIRPSHATRINLTMFGNTESRCVMSPGMNPRHPMQSHLCQTTGASIQVHPTARTVSKKPILKCRNTKWRHHVPKTSLVPKEQMPGANHMARDSRLYPEMNRFP